MHVNIFEDEDHVNAGAALHYSTAIERSSPSKTRKSRQTKKSSTGGFSCVLPASASLYKFAIRSYASSKVWAYPMSYKWRAYIGYSSLKGERNEEWNQQSVSIFFYSVIKK
jgi:hypothetical protein